MKMNDNRRIQLLWEEIYLQTQNKSLSSSSSSSASFSPVTQPPILQDNAKQLLLEYAEELALSLIESASVLAQSRGSKQIDESDIGLLLAKKLGVEIAGYEVNQTLHHSNLKSSIYSTAAEKTDISEQKKGIKRKHGG